MIALLLFLACAHKDAAVAASPVEAAAAAQAMAPTPYTAAQLRDALPVGTVVVYRRVEAGNDPYLNRMTMVSADAVGCKIANAIVDEQGNVVADEGETEADWEELRKHAEFPVAAVQTSEDAVDVPAGHFDTWKYIVTEPDGTVTTYQFARTLPGPPVRMEVRAHDTVVFSMELVSRTGP
jgi:hypothetical protein